MTDDVASLQIRVLTDQVEVANRRLASLEHSGAKAERSLDRVSKISFAQIAGTLAVMGVSVAGLASAANTATREWVSYDKAIKEVNSITSQTAGEFKTMRKDVLDLSVALGTDATQGARGLYQALSAGVPKQNAIAFLATASKAAIAGVTEVNVAVDGLTNTMNAYKIPFEEAEAVSDKLFATVVNGKTTFEELSANMSKATVPAAALGVGLDELLASIIGITKQGTPTSEAFTQVKATIQALNDPSEELLAVYKEMGVESGRAAIAQFGYAETLERVRQAYAGNDAALVKALRSSEAYNGVLSVTGDNLKAVKDGQDSVRTSSGQMAGAYAQNSVTLENALNSLKASAVNLVETMEQSYGIIQGFTSLLRDAAAALNGLNSSQSAITTGALNGAAAAGNSPIAVVQLEEGITKLDGLIVRYTESKKRLEDAGTIASDSFFARGGQNQLFETNETIARLTAEADKLRGALAKIPDEAKNTAVAMKEINSLAKDRADGLITEDQFIAKRQLHLDSLKKEQTALVGIRAEAEAKAKAVEAEAEAEKARRAGVIATAAELEKAAKAKEKYLEEAAKSARQLATTDKERLQLELRSYEEALKGGKINDEVYGKAKDNIEEQIRLLDERNSKLAGGGGGGGGGGAIQDTPSFSALADSLPGISNPLGASNPFDYLREQEDEIRASYERRREAILELTGITENERLALLQDAMVKYSTAMEQADQERQSIALQSASNFFGDLSTIAAAFGKRGHKLAQAAAIAQATIDMFASANAAYKATVGTPIIGPYIAPVAAGAAIAAGAMNIARIKQTSYSGEYEHGGLIPSGKYGLVGEAGAELVQGPANVVSARTTAGLLAGSSDKSSQPTINIHNYAGIEVETRQIDRGEKQKEIDIIIRKAVESVANSITTGQGAVAASLEKTYPLNRGQR